MTFTPPRCDLLTVVARGWSRAMRVALLSSRLITTLCIAGSVSLLAPAFAQTAATGAVEGRVQSAATGNYLNNARVRVAGTNREVFTNSSGEYRLEGLPPGQATLEVFFTGMAPQTITVAVPASGAAQRDVLLQDVNVRSDGTVVLNQFVVQSQRETDAAAIAINEQRFAPNRKDVVSTDAFGEINQGNIGEFVKFLPGISLDVKDGNTPSGIMIRGFDPNYTNVTMDGGQLASTIIANTQTSSRQFVLEGSSINNIARIEVTKLPTPDMSANLLGGAVNFVSRSAFERPRRELRVSTYLSANAKATELRRTPGPFDDDTFKVLPSFDLQFADPVSKRFGYVVTAQQSSQYYLQNKSVIGHNFRTAGATIANPYVTNVATSFAPNRSDRSSAGLTLDAKPWPDHVFQLKLLASANKQQTASRTLTYNVGGNQPVSWDEHNTLGAATGGSVSLGTSFQERHALTRAISGAWTFTPGDWKIEAAASFSNSNNRTRDMTKGFFRAVSVSLPNVGRVNLRDLDSSIPRFGAAEVFNTSGQRVDELKLSNWNLTQASNASEPLNAADDVKEARVNVARPFFVRDIPFTIKVGGAINDQKRDLDYAPFALTYLGPDGRASSGDESAGAFVSEADRGVSPGFGRAAPEWPDSFKIFQSWKQHPDWWTQTASQEGDMPRNRAIRSPWLHETVTAGYVMADTKLLRNRLRLVGGVRYELTEDEGRGFKQDADAVLQKDAQGNIVYTTNPTTGVRTGVIRPELLPSGSFAYNSVLYSYRGYYAKRHYSYYHPSVHATFNLTDDLLVRAAFAKTIGRPNLSDIVPNLFVGENLNFGVPGQSGNNIPGFITGAATNLRPWRAKNYDYTIEYYLPRNGLLMLNWYRKDIADFFGTVTQIADQALLNQLGVSSDALGYQYTRSVNIGDARIQGWEARVDFPLANLTAWSPLQSFTERWAKHFTVTLNATHLDLYGSRITSRDWKRFIPRSRNIGIRYNFTRLSGNLLANWRGKMLRDTSNIITGNSADANEYIRARWQIDGDINYQLTKRFSIFAAARNLFNAPSEWEVSGAGAPKWATITNYEDYGAQYSLGVRATF
jgi:TonB-dependent receptor